MVSLLVRATATHKLPESADLPAGYEPADIQFFLDADMAILAADSARYRRYLRGVRSEYSHFDDEAFRAGRMTFLRLILGRKRIFLSEEGLQLWEEPRGLICRQSSASGLRTRRGFCRLSHPSRIHLKHIPPRMHPY